MYILVVIMHNSYNTQIVHTAVFLLHQELFVPLQLVAENVVIQHLLQCAHVKLYIFHLLFPFSACHNYIILY